MAFLAASLEGNFEALLAVLDPDVVFRVDRPAVFAGVSGEVHRKMSNSFSVTGTGHHCRALMMCLG
jgi:hypothetical protein